jgi:hypothetical protein
MQSFGFLYSTGLAGTSNPYARRDTSSQELEEYRAMCNRIEFAPERSIDEGAAKLVDRLITLTESKPKDHVMVAGRHLLPVFLELCARQYLHACCRAGSAPRIADELADTLWILNAKSEDELVAFVANLGRDLRASGTVVIAIGSRNSKGFPFRLRHLLLDSGFGAAHQRAVAIGGDVYLIARKSACARAKAA